MKEPSDQIMSEMHSREEVQLRIQRLVVHNWWIISISGLCAFLVTLLVSCNSSPVYQTRVRFVISPNYAVVTDIGDLIRSIDTLDKGSVTATFADILNSHQLHSESIKILNPTTEFIKNLKISAVVLPESYVLELRIEGSDPKLIASMANEIGQGATETVRELYQIYDFDILERATIPNKPIHPQPIRDAILALTLGISAGFGLAVLREKILNQSL